QIASINDAQHPVPAAGQPRLVYVPSILNFCTPSPDNSTSATRLYPTEGRKLRFPPARHSVLLCYSYGGSVTNQSDRDYRGQAGGVWWVARTGALICCIIKAATHLSGSSHLTKKSAL